MSAQGLPPGYPTAWEADVVLRDGTVAHLRPIMPSDDAGLRRFHAGQSDESIYLRFFAPLRQLSDRDVHRFTHVDYADRVALVVVMRAEIVGVGRYDRVTARSAEVAFNISDHLHGKGIGSVLLEHLAAIAREEGISEFSADVLPQNRKMLQVFSDAGYVVRRHLEDGVVSVHFDIEPTDRSKAVALAREHRAEASSVRRMLSPSVVAVVGASRRESSLGNMFLTNLRASGFTGSVYAVNPHAQTVSGFAAVPTLSDVPAAVDLAVIAVPAEQVLDVVEACAAAEVKALLVVSSGFAEHDEEGTLRQAELVRRARSAGMRVLGPNSFGLINNDPAVRLNASLAPTVPPMGGFGLFAQSGALGIAVLASAARRRLGISSFGSAGNRADVSGNDFMQYWIDDEATKAVGLYLESMGNPRKFSRIARQLALAKPVIVIKSGVGQRGLPPGHTVRRTKARPEVFESMLGQAGVIRVENVHQLFDVAQVVVHQPLPRGRRVAVVSNSVALATLATQACDGWGLEVTHGPVSVATEAGPEQFRAALDAAFADPVVDSVLACFIPPQVTVDEDVARAVREASAQGDKPCVATFLGMRGVDDGHASVRGTGAEGQARAIPVYSLPEDAARALAAATKYGQWKRRDQGAPVAPTRINRRVAEDVVETVLSVHPAGRRLSADEATVLLAAYGIEVWPQAIVRTASEAAETAQRFGFPVVLKTTSPTLRHQGGTAGIRVDLTSATAVADAFGQLTDRLAPLDHGEYVVQRMANPGVMCVVSSDEDPLFGPVIAFSVAGLATELFSDIAYRIPPLTDVDVTDLLSGIRAAPLLDGHHGSPPVHREALADLVARVSVLADDMPEIASLTLNPVNAHADGVDVLGADIRLAPAPRRTDPGRRSLT